MEHSLLGLTDERFVSIKVFHFLFQQNEARFPVLPIGRLVLFDEGCRSKIRTVHMVWR